MAESQLDEQLSRCVESLRWIVRLRHRKRQWVGSPQRTAPALRAMLFYLWYHTFYPRRLKESKITYDSKHTTSNLGSFDTKQEAALGRQGSAGRTSC
jgi:hypothetical protein